MQIWCLSYVIQKEICVARSLSQLAQLTWKTIIQAASAFSTPQFQSGKRSNMSGCFKNGAHSVACTMPLWKTISSQAIRREEVQLHQYYFNTIFFQDIQLFIILHELQIQLHLYIILLWCSMNCQNTALIFCRKWYRR